MNMAFPKSLHRRLAIAALDDGASMNYLVTEAVREWLERRDKKLKRSKR